MEVSAGRKLPYVTAFCLLACPTLALACSPVAPIPVNFDPAAAASHESPPKAPHVIVASIKRGKVEPRADSCNDLGMIVMAVPATPENRSLLYTFEQISGQVQDGPLNTLPSMGIEEDGQLLFPLSWLDGAQQRQEPLDLIIRVTPYRRSGLPGSHVDVPVKNPGRDP